MPYLQQPLQTTMGSYPPGTWGGGYAGPPTWPTQSTMAAPPQLPTGNWWGPSGPRIVPWGPGTAYPTPQWEEFYGGAPGGGPEAMAWMNVVLPWFQQAQAEQQFRTQMQHLQWSTQMEQELARQQLAQQAWATRGGWQQQTEQQRREIAWLQQQQQAQLGWYQREQQAQLGWERQQQQAQLEYQRWAQGGEWGQRTAEQERELGWERERQAEQLGFQRWAQAGEWEQAAQRQAAELATRETQAAYESFGRRWRPQTRWM